MAFIYHGCFTKNADGTNKFIGPGDKRPTPTAQCFCKDPKDVRSGVRTRSQLDNLPNVRIEDYRYCFQKKERIQRWISGTENSTMRESDEFFLS